MKRIVLVALALVPASALLLGGGYPFPASDHQTGKPGAFIGSKRCGACHGDAYAAWNLSGHARMVRAADPAEVLGDFTVGPIFEHEKERIAVARDGDRFTTTVAAPDGSEETFTVEAVLGGDGWFQQYLARDGNGAWRDLPMVWDVARATWIILNRDALTGRPWAEHRYAGECARCHVTGLEARGASGTFTVPDDARIFEFGVGCEACHGPGADHAAWRLADAKGRAKGEDPYAPMKAWSDAARGDLCASCHAPGTHAPPDWTPGAPLPASARAGREAPLPGTRTFHFWADGTEEVPFSSIGVPFLPLGRHLRPERCGDCHDPHGSAIQPSLRASTDDDALCASCHRDEAALGERHTGHPVASRGSRCVECHMPRVDTHYTGWTAAHDLRTHAMPEPDPGATLRYATPNACNLCHADRSPEWAADALARRRVERDASGGDGE